MDSNTILDPVPASTRICENNPATEKSILEAVGDFKLKLTLTFYYQVRNYQI